MKTILCRLATGLLITFTGIIAGCDANTIDTFFMITTGGKVRWCSLEDYGTVQFQNKSSTNRDYYIYWNNEYVGIVKAGKTEPENDDFTVDEGNHNLEFRFTSGATACGPETVTIKECEWITYTCSN